MIIKIYNLLRLIRIGNILIGILTILLSSFILQTSNHLIILIIITSSAIGLGNIINDLFDIKTDRQMHPNRPLIKGEIQKFEAVLFIIFLFLIILYYSVQLPQPARSYLYYLLLPLLFLYSIVFKNIPLIGNVVVAFLLASVFFFAETTMTTFSYKLLIPALLAFGLNCIRELVKDIQDHKGDKMNHINTLPVYCGIKMSTNITILCSVIFGGLCLAPYITGHYNQYYLLSIIFLIEIPLFVLVFLLYNNPNKTIIKCLVQLTKTMVINGAIVLFIANI